MKGINKHLAEKYNNQHFNYIGNWKHITSSIIDGQGTIINGRTYFYTDDNGTDEQLYLQGTYKGLHSNK